jgi:N-hydroxyarylamine O-acetyltransferase
VLDLAAYLDRVGLVASPSLTPAQVQRAQVTHIPFENLDPFLGAAVSLEQGDLERKLVHERRGGYCFEQNLLLKSALEELGAEVEMLLGRVRVGGGSHHQAPLTHLALRVGHRAQTWLADGGFGRGTLLEPIPLQTGAEHTQDGWRYRLIEDPPGLALQTWFDGGWHTMYGFVVEPVPFADVELGNWFTSTHPSSPFQRTLRVAVRDEDGGQVTLAGDPSGPDGLTLVEQWPAERRSRPVAGSDLAGLLRGRFGIDGFGVDEHGRVAPVAPGGLCPERGVADPEAVAAVIVALRAGEDVAEGELGPTVVEAILTEPHVGEALEGLEGWLDGTVEHEAALTLAASWALPASRLDLDTVTSEVRLYIDAYPMEARVLGGLPDRAATWLVARLAQTAPDAVGRLPQVRRAITALARLAERDHPSASASLRAAEAALDDEALWYQVALCVVRDEIDATAGPRE